MFAGIASVILGAPQTVPEVWLCYEECCFPDSCLLSSSTVALLQVEFSLFLLWLNKDHG